MAGNTQDVELRIRARDYSQKTLEQVTQALGDLAKAQDEQLSSAKRGEASAKSLEASYRRIEDAAKALLNQASLIKIYEAQSATLKELQERTEAARDAQSKYALSLGQAGAVSKAQTREQEKLATATERAEKAQQRAADRLDVTASRLQAFGITAQTITSAQQQIAQGIGVANKALERQDQALQTLDADLKQYKTQFDDTIRAASIYAEASKRQAAEELKRAELQNRWTTALNNIQKAHYRAAEAAKVQADAEASLQARLNQAADAADGKAKGYATLARPQRAQAAPSVSASVSSVIDPSGSSMKTLDGIEAAVARVEKRAAAAAGPVKGFKDALSDMRAAQSSISTLAGVADAYQRQIQAVREARQEYVAARSAVSALAAQMRSGVGGEELVRQMAQAQSKLQSAAESMGRQVSRARELQGALQSAGVSTTNVASTQAQLQGAAQRSVDATNKLTAAVKQFGVAADDTDKKAKAWSFFHTQGERTTLSYMQRLRGEVLAMGTAFVGLQAAVNLAKGAIDVTLANAKIQNKLSVLFEGDVKRAGEEFQYLKDISNTIGISFETAAQGYTKFAIGAKAAGFTNQEIRFTFENLSIAAKNAGLSTEEYGGVLKAVEQMMSKGVIQAEELKGQLGDRLPGAVTFLAKSMGKTTGELLKMMEQGGVTARYVLNLATTVGTEFSKVQDTAATRLQAALNRQENATRDFKQALGESGFIEAYTEFLQKLTVLMNSPDGKNLANTLGQAFTALVDGARWAAEHIDLLKGVLIAFAGVKVFGILTTWTESLALLTVGMRTATVASTGLLTSFATAVGAGGVVSTATAGIGALATAFRVLGKSIPYLGVALTVWELGSVLYDKMGNKAKTAALTTEEEAKRLKEYNDNINKIPTSAPGVDAAGRPLNNGLTPNPGTQVSPDDAIVDAVNKSIGRDAKGKPTGTMAKKIDKKDEQSRMSAAKTQLAERQQIATEELRTMRENADTQIKDATKKAETLKLIDAEIKKVMAAEERKFNAEQAKSGESAAAKRLRLATEVAQGLEQLANKTAEREAQNDPNATFEQRMEARARIAADTYNEVAKRLEQLDLLSKGGASKEVNAELQKKGFKSITDAKAKLNAGKQDAMDEARKEAAQKEIERLQKELTDAQTALDRREATINARVENGVLTRDQGAQGIAEASAKLSPNILKASEALRAFATQYQDRLKPDKFNEIIAQADLLAAKLNPNKTAFDASLKVNEAKLQEALDRRAAGLTEIDSMQKQSLIDQDQAAQRINATYANSKDTIQQYLNTLQGMITARLQSTQVGDEERAKLELLREKYRQQGIEVSNVSKAYGVMEQAQIDATASGVTSGISDVTNGLSDILTGQKSVGDGFRSMGQSLVQTFANIAKSILNTIIQMQIAKKLATSDSEILREVGVKLGGTRPQQAAAPAATDAASSAAGTAVTGAAEQTAATTAAAALTTAGTTTATTITTAATGFGAVVEAAGTTFATIVQSAAAGQAVGGAVGGAVQHAGGITGESGVRRSVSASWFNGAPKFHNGGIPGLARDEVPAVLQRGEEVLTRNDPRHVLNGGKAGAAAAQQSNPGSRFVLVDDRTKVAEAMSSAEGESVTMVHLKRNIPTLKSWLR